MNDRLKGKIGDYSISNPGTWFELINQTSFYVSHDVFCLLDVWKMKRAKGKDWSFDDLREKEKSFSKKNYERGC